MILQQVTFKNFGIYGGESTFDLQPLALGNFHRPVVLLRGKNGVGKTTFVEAIRFGLHGNLVVGSRVGQQEYDAYLRQRLHRPHHAAAPTTASVDLRFAYVNLGKKLTYRVLRQWEVQEKKVEKAVTIWENDEPFVHWDAEQCDQFLRELIPPGVLDLFFFDGERIQTLAEVSEVSNLLLAETVRGLLGLDVVDQLSRDLDVYVSRQKSHGEVADLQRELTELKNEEESIGQDQAVAQSTQAELAAAIEALQKAIALTEQQLANAGGNFAAKRDTLQSQLHQLDSEIEAQEKVVQELCGGLMPFAIAPTMLQAVAKRLDLEHEYERTRTARQVLNEKLDLLQRKITSDDYWELIGASPEPLARHNLFEKLATDLQDLVAGPQVAPEEIILRVGAEERQTLQGWIQQARHDVPHTFMQAVNRLQALQQEQTALKEALAQAPKEESLQPILQELGQLHQQLGAQQRELKSVTEHLQTLQRRLDRVTAQQQRIREQMKSEESDTSRVYMALTTQTLLTEYKARLAAHKIDHVAELLVRYFNRLCRKERFLDRVTIDPETFRVTLYRLGREFSRQQLSAGENQLFAVATLWALREVSGRPMPVIIDTPLSRLDSEHRLSMVQEFFPHTSHHNTVYSISNSSRSS
ncbi:MAG TPA: DNA sulfur modification protein DndD [Caldilineaceae bacterium]|nr:DNA sulfur modification protein DndD [Caldilineaceae bacterium]